MSKKNGKKSSAKDFQKEIKDVAQNVWLAGLGALSAAEEEGGKLFKKLVARGQEYEKKNRPWVEEKAKEARARFEEAAETAKSRFEAAVEGAGKAVDEQVGATLERLGVPTRDEIHRLTQRVEELNKKLETLGTKPAPKKPAAAKTEAAAPKKAPARKPAAKKTPEA